MSVVCMMMLFYFFFFNDTATTEIYTLSLHDALPICLVDRYEGALPPFEPARVEVVERRGCDPAPIDPGSAEGRLTLATFVRSEEHTSELQSRQYLVCRLLLEKKIRNSNPKIIQLRPY